MYESNGARRAVVASGAQVGDRHEAVWKEYVQRCAQQESGALANLYDESSSLVYSVALRMLTNEADAEEVTLDVYTQVWRTAPQYDASRGSVTAWLVTITRSRAIDKVRARSVRLSLEEPLEGHTHHRNYDFDPEAQTALNQKRGRIVEAMRVLTPDQRRAIELAFFSGLSHSELATQLGAPLGTVKTRIRLGMMKLKDVLGSIS